MDAYGLGVRFLRFWLGGLGPKSKLIKRTTASYKVSIPPTQEPQREQISRSRPVSLIRLGCFMLLLFQGQPQG